jgi:Surface adhesin CshA repetitive domain
MTNGETVGYSFWHKSTGTTGAMPETVDLIIGGDLIDTHTATADWEQITGTTTYTGPSGAVGFQFVGTSPAVGSGLELEGNLIDNVELTLVPYIQFAAASGSGPESTSATSISVQISGTVPAGGLTVPIVVSGGSATSSTDYVLTSPLVIPAGVYANATFPIPLAVTNDSLVESSETIDLSFGPLGGAAVVASPVCGIAIPTATYTITDDDVAPTIDAVDDAPPAVSGAAGGTTPSVLGNDTLNGAPFAPAAVTLTPGTILAPPAAGSITMSPATGVITVAAGTTPGTYLFPYEICENPLPSTNCDPATATVVVSGPTTPVLEDDISSANVPGTPVTIAVLSNDQLVSGLFDPLSITILGAGGAGLPLVVPGQGTWTVDLGNGTITFTPEPGFVGNPTPIQYTVTTSLGIVLAPASVIVTYENSPAFFCADIIGKVFDDINQDGRQDAGEAGLPGVRLATVNGELVTTDEYGRYSIPCAALPSDIGSTFLLKLDPRTLPTGYRVTTENPRTIRLTPGMMRRMNFGATLSDVVQVDLTSAAFDTQTGAMTDDLERGLGALVGEIAKTPSTLRLTYFLAPGEDADQAGERLDLLEDHLRKLWRGRGAYKLSLEKTVVEKN